MDSSYLQNVTRLRAVARALQPLEQKVVFVGGATIALYTNPATALEVRPTDDIDVVVELATYSSYAKSEERLREIGFINDQESKIICRYKIKGMIVDIMPTDPKIIGFSNQWYPEGFENAILHPLTERESIYISLWNILWQQSWKPFSQGVKWIFYSAVISRTLFIYLKIQLIWKRNYSVLQVH